MGRTDSGNSGLRTFKSGWGAEEMPLAYTSLSDKRRPDGVSKVQPIMNAVIRNSPPWVCRTTGELLYKHFG
jgi:hypothetical protein